MKILLVTGRLAQRDVRKIAINAEKYNLKCDLLILPISVAAFITPKLLKENLKNKCLEYDLVIIPGMARGNYEELGNLLNLKIVKGTRYIGDMESLLPVLSRVLDKFSPVNPADELIEYQPIHPVEKEKPKRCIDIDSLPIYRGCKPKIIAEIVDAPLLDVDDVVSRAIKFASMGADIIDIGMIASESNPEKAFKLIHNVKRKVLKPISIDSMDPNEIKMGVKAGAKLILSIDMGNMSKLPNYTRNIPAVVTPTNMERGIYPKTFKDSLEMLNVNVENARKLGYKKLIIDPMLHPPIIGLSDSIAAYRVSLEKFKNPVFMGVGNVTEMIDADSLGVNALLACLAVELNVSLMLTVESSVKTRYSVKELARAIDLAWMAKLRNQPPKDLGVSLLKLKSKRIRDVKTYKNFEGKIPILSKLEKLEFKLDPKGCFRIEVDHDVGEIVVIHYPTKSKNPDWMIKGKSYYEIRNKLLALNAISRIDHAFYIGYELAKAENALESGGEYIQD
ncbi:MAG: dihydropteroate synthase-like protein [Candidatus Methanomethylicia archaeon]